VSRLAGLLVAIALLLPAGPAPSAEPDATTLANGNTVALLSAAREALHKLDFPPAGDGAAQPRIYFDSAAESLTALYQLYGCEWAADELRALYAREIAPELRIGYSTDGRVQLRVEPLDLLNPAFEKYTVLLCTLRSETAADIVSDAPAALLVTVPDGVLLRAESVTQSHPLWRHLRRLAPQFGPPQALPSGAGIGFKQLYAVPRSSLPLNQCTVLLAWGGLSFELPRWDTQEAADGRT
jgi:hypothetical protein